MNVSMNPGANRISALRTGRFAPSEQESAAPSEPRGDEVSISQEGREAAAHGPAAEPDSLEAAARFESILGGMTREEFQALTVECAGELKPNPYWEVDPDRSIAWRTYWDSLSSQAQATEDAIKDYYDGAYREAVASPMDSLLYIASKYLYSGSKYFAADMTEDARQWAYTQVRAMLTDSPVRPNDPYALAASGGVPTFEQSDKIARQAVKDALDALVRERNASRTE